jgi:hypothetical protein
MLKRLRNRRVPSCFTACLKVWNNVKNIHLRPNNNDNKMSYFQPPKEPQSPIASAAVQLTNGGVETSAVGDKRVATLHRGIDGFGITLTDGTTMSSTESINKHGVYITAINAPHMTMVCCFIQPTC